MIAYAQGWACLDCTVLIANGETPPEWNETRTEAWLEEIEFRSGEGYWELGGEHDDDCPNMVNGEWVGNTDCYCEHLEFSWCSCSVCGSHLGGSRDAVTFFEKEG